MPSVAANSPAPLTISVAAGKGGTGKTLVSTSLAIELAYEYPDKVALLDGDVEEPNADLLMPTVFEDSQPVHILVPEVDAEACIHCGKCAEACQASAIAKIRDVVVTFHELCTGCGACAYVCPVDAIAEVPRKVGRIDRGIAAGSVEFTQGRSEIAQQHTGSVTSALKAHIKSGKVSIVDAPPGTSCPMQETIEDSDYCILVTEPTPFGLNDLKAAVETCRTLSVPHGVVINRDGIGDRAVEDYCKTEGISVLLKIPHERRIAEAYSRGETLVLAFPEWRGPLGQVFDAIVEEVAQ